MDQKRSAPAGVLILAGMAFAAGFWQLLTACHALWWSGRQVLFWGGFSNPSLVVGTGFDLLCLGLFGLALAVAWLVIADALYNQQTWAWQLALIAASASLLFALLQMFVSVLDPGRFEFPWGALIALAINGLIAWFLLRTDVRGVFNPTPPDDGEAVEAAAKKP